MAEAAAAAESEGAHTDEATAQAAVDDFLAEEEAAGASVGPPIGATDATATLGGCMDAASAAAGPLSAEEAWRQLSDEDRAMMEAIGEEAGSTLVDQFLQEGGAEKEGAAMQAGKTSTAAVAEEEEEDLAEEETRDESGLSPGVLRTMLQMHSVDEVGMFLLEMGGESWREEDGTGGGGGTPDGDTGGGGAAPWGLPAMVSAPSKMELVSTAGDVFDDVDEYIAQFIEAEEGVV